MIRDDREWSATQIMVEVFDKCLRTTEGFIDAYRQSLSRHLSAVVKEH